jgi:hypothetical protein
MPEAISPATTETPTEAAPVESTLTPGQKSVAPPVAETPVTETVVSPRIAKLKELGFENVTSEDEAFDRIVSAFQNTKNEFGSQLQAALAELKQTPAQPTTTPPAQDAHTGKWNWAPPAVDQQLLARFRTADGWKPETPAEVRQAAEARQAYLDSFAQKFVADPAATLEPLLEDKFNAYFEMKTRELAAQQQFQIVQQKITTENPWLFEADPITSKPKPGVLSAEGKLIDQYMQEAQARGADYELSWECALSKHAAAKAARSQQQTAQTQTAAQVNAQVKQDFVNRAAGTPNRTGSMPTASDSRSSQRNKALTAGERFMQVVKRDGLPLSN